MGSEDEEEEGVMAQKQAGGGASGQGKKDILKRLFDDDDDSDDDSDDENFDAKKAKRVLKSAGLGSDSDEEDDVDEIAAPKGRGKEKAKGKGEKGGARVSKKGKGEEKASRGKKSKGEKPAARPKRSAAGKDAGEAAAEKRPMSEKEKAAWDKVMGGSDSENDEPPVRTAEDDAFIDDSGVAPEDRWDDDDDEPKYASEAEEEDDEIEKIFQGTGVKRRRDRMDNDQANSQVLALIAKMEVAAEKDIAAYESRQPAIHKLKILSEVVEELKMVELHDKFLTHGGLAVLQVWLNLLPDGNLPNLKIRTALIDIIKQLPIETDMQDRKEQLKASGLGRIIMFLSELPEETTSNRRVCKALIEKWSRPVYELSSHYRDVPTTREEDFNEEERERKRKKKAAAAAARARAEEATDIAKRAQQGPRYGEAGYRYHAVVPEPEAMDYTVRPQLQIDPNEIKKRTQTADQQRVRKLVSKVGKKRSMKDSKAYLPSVEGRGLVSYH